MTRPGWQAGWKAVLLATFLATALMGGRLDAQAPPQSVYYVYVAAESQDQVALVRFGPGGTEVAKVIEAGLNPTDIDGPHGIAIGPDGSNWYVSIAHGWPHGQIHKYATGTDENVGRAEVGLFPATMAVSRGGLLFVVNFNLHGDPVPSSVSVVETESMTEIRKIETCAMPHGSRLSADGRRHYSVCMMDDQLVSRFPGACTWHRAPSAVFRPQPRSRSMSPVRSPEAMGPPGAAPHGCSHRRTDGAPGWRATRTGRSSRSIWRTGG
jgi:DNA-binding beta-propeller fold protein YncE